MHIDKRGVMNSEKSFIKRSVGMILVFTAVLFILILSLGYWGIFQISQRVTALASAHPDIADFKAVALWTANFTRVGLLSIAAGLVLWILFSWLAVRRMSSLTKPISSHPQPAEKENRLDREQQDKRLFLHLLGMLQREGRFLDFLSENLDAYEDDQIGAAVRSIHENCNKITRKYLTLEPVLDQEEGQPFTLQKGFDTAAIKLVGNVSGEPPFTGVIRHRGWKTPKVELPTLSAAQDASLIAPAEVEIS